jgi:hypothetical protein
MGIVRHCVVASAVALVLSGCASTSEPQDPSTEDTVSTSPGEPTPSPSPVAQQAVTDLAGTLGVDEGDITLLELEEVTWRDGSLGCAQSGKMYTQALVDGQRIVLSAGGQRYEYHSGGGRDAFYCENPTQ